MYMSILYIVLIIAGTEAYSYYKSTEIDKFILQLQNVLLSAYLGL